MVAGGGGFPADVSDPFENAGSVEGGNGSVLSRVLQTESDFGLKREDPPQFHGSFETSNPTLLYYLFYFVFFVKKRKKNRNLLFSILLS